MGQTAYLLLFDLDGTLVQTSAGRRALRRTFRELFAVDDIDAGMRLSGLTDPAIFRQCAVRLDAVARGRPVDGADGPHDGPHDNETTANTYLAALATEMQNDPGQLCPGVATFLAAVAREPDLFMGLGTGNIEAGARLKLAPHGLNRFFPTGGFGSDAEDRAALIAVGIERAGRHYGIDFAAVVVIGDTPLDVAAGRANGALTLGVATGGYAAADLTAAGADLVLPSLAEPGALAALRKLFRREVQGHRL